MKNATFRQLRVFCEVAKHLSFVRAAETLYLTPPAVTMQIKELEGHVGMPLFERSGKKVSLTTSGEYMLVYARKILATVKDAEDAAARLLRAETGVLTIGMVSTSKYFLLKLIGDFKLRHTGVDIQLAIGNRDQLFKMLGNNEVDIAIMGRPPKEFQTRVEPFAAHPHVFICSPDHPLASDEKELSVYDISNENFIVREQGSGTRAAMEKFFIEHNVELRKMMNVTSNETLKQAVIANLGLGFLSIHTIGEELKRGSLKVLHVKDSPVIRAWNVVYVQSKYLSPIAEAFRVFMLENAKPYLEEQFGGYLDVKSLVQTA